MLLFLLGLVPNPTWRQCTSNTPFPQVHILLLGLAMAHTASVEETDDSALRRGLSVSACPAGEFDGGEGCESCSGLASPCDDCVCPDFNPQVQAACTLACLTPPPPPPPPPATAGDDPTFIGTDGAPYHVCIPAVPTLPHDVAPPLPASTKLIPLPATHKPPIRACPLADTHAHSHLSSGARRAVEVL